eukprot:356780-Chlamydomonas_euryale.AAC.3
MFIPFLPSPEPLMWPSGRSIAERRGEGGWQGGGGGRLLKRGGLRGMSNGEHHLRIGRAASAGGLPPRGRGGRGRRKQSYRDGGGRVAASVPIPAGTDACPLRSQGYCNGPALLRA